MKKLVRKLVFDNNEHCIYTLHMELVVDMVQDIYRVESSKSPRCHTWTCGKLCLLPLPVVLVVSRKKCRVLNPIV